jgi:hypothetical protein
MSSLFDIHRISSKIQRILDGIPYPQFAERICGYPWVLRTLLQSNHGKHLICLADCKAGVGAL